MKNEFTMMKHIDIELKADNLKSGFGFEVYKFAVENHLTGKLAYTSKGNCQIQIDGSETAISVFVNWCLHSLMESWISQMDIRNGPIQHHDQFTIENTKSS